MVTTAKDLLGYLNNIAPFSLAESWDNNGLLVGSANSTVTSILVGLDPSNSLLAEAIAKGCDTIITHHPAIFKPLPTINTDTPTGKFIQKALCHNITIIACHTNLDSAVDGVSDSLGRALGLSDMQPIIASPSPISGAGMGRIGRYKNSVSRTTFLQTVLDILALNSIQLAGNLPEQITSVALCGGSGSDLAAKTQDLGADVYLTAEVKHSTARWAEETGYCIIDGTHYSTEQFAVNLLVEKLKEAVNKNNWQINISSTETEQHPFVSIDRNSLT